MRETSILATHESPHCTVPIVIAHQAQQQTGREAMWALGRRPEQICHGRPRSARIIRAKKDRGGDESNAEGRDAGIRRGLNELPSLWRRVVAGDVFALDSERRMGRRSSTLKSTN
jgi:hypothetical protein